MTEETKLFLQKLKNLDDMLKCLQRYELTSEYKYSLSHIQERLQVTKNSVEVEGSLNAGGKFEWVDSVLVKCLQNGSWLLIDNVNLCSPAVLDRLNALLEPNGTLTIGERGIDENGKMIDIKPHKNFRLFLTMDPKNGEISRAMRNRGIEIYMLNNKEYTDKCSFDIKSLINHKGLSDYRYIQVMLKIHDYVRDLVLGDKPGIDDLLQSSFLISQQLKRGISVRQAFLNTIIDVYYNTRSSHDFNTNNPAVAIEAEINTLLNSYCSEETQDLFNYDVTLKTKDLQFNSDLSKIKQQWFILKKHLELNTNNCSENNKKMIQFLLMHFYSITSLEDVEVRYKYIQNYFESNKLDLKQINGELYNQVLKSKVVLETKKLPVDIRWLPDSPYTNETISQCNRTLLAFYFLSYKLLNEVWDDVEQPKGRKDFTVLQYMKCVKYKTIKGNIDDIVVEELYDLLNNFDQFVMDLFNNKTLDISNENAVEIMSVLEWRFILYQVLNRNIITNIKKSEYDEILTTLHVHYKWFIKWSILQLKRILNISTDNNITEIVNRINSALPNHFSVLKKIAKHYQKAINKSPPLINNTQVTILSEFNKIADSFDLYKRGNNPIAVLNIILTESSLTSLLVDLKAELNYEFIEVPEKYRLLKEIHERCENIEVKDVCKRKFVNILPIMDYFALLLTYTLKSDLNNDVLNVITVPTNLQGVLKRYRQEKDDRLIHEIISCLTQYIINCASLNPSDFLNFGIAAEEERDSAALTSYMPVLSYLISSLCVSGNNQNIVTPTEFGSYRDAMEQHQYLNVMLWRNMQQLSDLSYDYVFSETKYLKLSFKRFLNNFAVSIGVSINADPSGVYDYCIKEIERIYTTSEVKDIDGDRTTLINLLRICYKEVSYLDEDVCLTSKINCFANVYISLSYIQAWLNSKLAPIDPLTKVTLKRKYCAEEENNFECLKRSYELQNEVYSNTEKTLSPLCKILSQKIELLHEKSLELGQYVAVRPESLKYDSILKEVNHAFSTRLSVKNILELYDNLSTCFELVQGALTHNKDADVSKCNNFLKLTTSTQHSIESFIYTMNRYQCTYPDIIEPLLSNVRELLYGIKLKSSLLKKVILQLEHAKIGIELHENLINLIKFPARNQEPSDYIKVVDLYVKDNMQNCITKCLQNSEEPDLAKQQKFSLLKCTIHEIYNVCVMDAKYSQMLSKELFHCFNKLIKVFVNAWNRQESEREIKIKESESLYKMKTKCKERTEEELIEDEFMKLFPNYHDKDFPDMQASNLEGSNLDVPNFEPEYVGLISMNDVKFVCDLHSQLMHVHTKSEWLSPNKKNLVCNYVTPLIQKFGLFNLLLKRNVSCLNYNMDTEIMGSLIVLTRVAQKFGDVQLLDDTGSPNRFMTKKHYDFYADANVEEIKSSFPILEELRLQVLELLIEWPDHPVLQNITSIIQRIYGFNITSPISRFLTGFEILLTKCNEWEQNAHVGVSLQQYILNLTQKIIVWRKIELNAWKDSLNNSFDRMNDPISKWWLYIYHILEQFTQENMFTVSELVDTLQKFIIQSSLAEFVNRLELLYTFHCHCVHLEKTEKIDIFMNIMWNLYEYYTQFIHNVNARIKELRSPIEKKLKDYVKIVRWKDISYWAVKETLEKTHKTIHKYMREFENVLKQPVLPCLVNTTSSTKDYENVGIWDRPQRVSLTSYHYTMDPVTYMAKQILCKKLSSHIEIKSNEENFLLKTEKYFNKARLLCRDTVSLAKYPTLIQILDGFVADVIENSTRLQNLEVDTTLPKNKQKTQARSILHQKHRALADLFKNLSKIGISYRTGIVESKLKDVTFEFLLKPLNLDASLNHLSHRLNDKKLLTIWDGCEMYYTKSLMRLDILNSALNNPAKDLGLRNVERCKGFSEHLMKLGYEQKSSLIDSTRNLYYLRYYSTFFSEFCEEATFLHVDTYSAIIAFLKNLIVVMEQYKLILNSCPEEVVTGADLNSIPVLKPELLNTVQYKNDDLWNRAWTHVSSTICIGEKILSLLNKSKTNIPYTDSNIICPKYLPVLDFQTLKLEVNAVQNALNHLLVILGNIPLNDSLRWLIAKVNEISVCLNRSSEAFGDSSVDVDHFTKSNERLIQKILLSIQNMYKKYKEIPVKEDGLESQAEEDNDCLSDGHLKLMVIDNLFEDLAQISTKQILNCVRIIAEEISEVNPTHKKEFKSIISLSMPFVEQFILLCEYFITQQVSAYRVTCKMSSVLLNIFIDLATKGFCIPPEFSEELDSDGQGQTSSGMGLGDGEGERDVSDRIESEDQLEEAQPAGQEKKQDDDKDHGEEEKGIEMSEDFDSKLQDVEKQADEEKEESNSDAEEQMGETDKDAEQLDQQIWSSDEDVEENGNEDEQSEGQGDKGKKEAGQQLAPKEKDAKESEEDKEADDPNSNEKEKSKKEINEMEEPEYDDEQVDPYHGNQPQQPEPEPFDLPEDMHLDENEKGKDESQEENPFDIDTMKEQIPPEEKSKESESTDKEDSKETTDENAEEETEEEEEEAGVDNQQAENLNEPDKKEDDGLKTPNAEDEKDETADVSEQSALDQTQTNRDEAQAMDVNDAEAVDNVQANQSRSQKALDQNEETCQEDSPDTDGIGQSKMEESNTGHMGQANAQQQSVDAKEDEKPNEKRQRPGDSDAQRSLGDTSEPVKKKLKTMDIQENEHELQEDETAEDEENAEMYQHIRDAKSSSEQVLDTATKEQVEQQKEVPNLNEDNEDIPLESSDNLPEEEPEKDSEIIETVKQKAEKVDAEKGKRSDKSQHPEGDILEDIEDIEIEGDIVKTTTVPRGGESTHHTQFRALTDNAMSKISTEEMSQLRIEVQQQLSFWNEPPTTNEAKEAWEKISSVTLPLAQDLSEQLRLVLEPTQASRLRGDFRTGKRINMRKIIPYIASQFRKDKIWLRRTKPSKREYQIVLAIDDSSSMADNHSKELAFESVALISKALTLLESGQLAVLSFGETTEVLHKLTDTFTESSGSKLLQKFQFAQKKTCTARLVDFATEMLTSAQSQASVLNAKLLIIVSDGRGIFSEGENYVQHAIRRARLSNIFMVFVIVDNPKNANSILDIRMPVFSSGKLLDIKSYMDSFPFPFYIILRDINSLPSVMSDALRQWFEMVSNIE